MTNTSRYKLTHTYKVKILENYWSENIIYFIFLDVNSQSQPQITRDILPSIKRVGETGSLSCTVARKQNNVVHWLHKGRSMTADNEVINVGISKLKKFQWSSSGYRFNYQLEKAHNRFNIWIMGRGVLLESPKSQCHLISGTAYLLSLGWSKFLPCWGTLINIFMHGIVCLCFQC